jgi:hypothetical protein
MSVRLSLPENRQQRRPCLARGRSADALESGGTAPRPGHEDVGALAHNCVAVARPIPGIDDLDLTSVPSPCEPHIRELEPAGERVDHF